MDLVEPAVKLTEKPRNPGSSREARLVAMAVPSPDPRRCPLCQRVNGCASAEGKAGCWCETVEIPAEVLERVPEAEKGRVCVCRACAGERPAMRKLAVAGSSNER
jgi:hypothetical protein